ncbi:MAG: peptidylprolyl isomerase [Bacteroidales bacterium]|nr:peptidylprolyl isomerase [Bacteroidales bacterium]
MNKHFKLIFALAMLLTPLAGRTQVIDKVVAVVGGEKILLSDIEEEYMRSKMQGGQSDLSKCQLLENMLTHKLLLNQAKIDSLESNAMNVENELERRLRYFVAQIGSEQALERYFNRSMYQIKDDLRESIAEQMLAQQMQQKIVEKVNLTPEEIKHFYNEIPQDSIPEVPLQYELQQIMIYPPASNEAKYAVRQKLLDIRERVLNGERFTTLATLYSEDRASAVHGGELGMRSRDEYVKEFANAAFNLKEGQVSSVVESEYGFHLIQMIENKGNTANVRHILMKPQYSSDMMSAAVARLDSISTAIASDSITFEKAAARFSADKKSAMNHGVVINPYTGTTLFQKEQLETADYYIIRDLREGEYSKPFESRDEHTNVALKVIKVKRIIPAHRANLTDDYDAIQRIAKTQAEHSILKNWVRKTVRNTFIKIDPEFHSCKFEMPWVK